MRTDLKPEEVKAGDYCEFWKTVASKVTGGSRRVIYKGTVSEVVGNILRIETRKHRSGLVAAARSDIVSAWRYS